MESSTAHELTSPTTDVLKEYLLAEHESLRDAFWRNEELGERRLQFFLGLVTAVFGGLGVLATTDKGLFSNHPERIADVATGGLIFLLVVGWMTLGRINKRDRVSDDYKEGLDQIRNCFLRCPGKIYPALPEPLATHWPLGCHSPHPPLRVGWLARLVMSVNAIIVGTLTIALVYLRTEKFAACLWAVPVAVALAGVIQWLWASGRLARSE
jgi:hypothetical protein